MIVYRTDKNRIRISYEIVSVFHQPISVFSTIDIEYLKEYGERLAFPLFEEKIIEILINIKINKKNFKIPCVYILNKSLKNQYWNEFADKQFNYSEKSSKDITYYKVRSFDFFEFSRQISFSYPLLNLFKKKNNIDIINIVNYLETVSIREVSKSEYELIDIKKLIKEDFNKFKQFNVNSEFSVVLYILKPLKIDRLNKRPILNLNYYLNDLDIFKFEKHFNWDFVFVIESINSHNKGYNFKGQEKFSKSPNELFRGKLNECKLKLNNLKELKSTSTYKKLIKKVFFHYSIKLRESKK